AANPNQGTAFGILARNGDNNGAIMPSFSHDGQRVVYMSTSTSIDGRPAGSDGDLFVVPYNNRMGGAASPIQGASDPAFIEYYPSLASDDALIAFNRVDANQNTYDEPTAEVFVIPTNGGTATRLDANDPSACTGEMSPGVTNSWPKWAPQAVTIGSRTF